jgi:Sulfotransferase domain
MAAELHSSVSKEHRPMALDIIGAGFGRTGTLSLKQALEQLGFNKCYHMMEIFGLPTHPELWRAAHRGEPVDWEALFTGYRASVDWPSCNFWREQMLAFPKAKVILSLRDSDSWYQSIMNTIWKFSSMSIGTPMMDSPQVKMVFELIWDGKFQRRMDDKKHVIEVYEQHNRDVIDSVPKEQLLVYRPGDGWEPLCRFLGVAIPAVPYPKVNSTEDFEQMMAQRKG